MYDEIIEIAENRAYLNAVKQAQDFGGGRHGPNLDLLKTSSCPPYEELGELEQELKTAGLINFDTVSASRHCDTGEDFCLTVFNISQIDTRPRQVKILCRR
eukprot:135171_1